MPACQPASDDSTPVCLLAVCVQVEEIELKPGGTDIDVTEDNRKEYIE